MLRTDHLKRFSRWLPILAAISLCDIHLGIMQVATWVEMTAQSPRTESVVESAMRSVTGQIKCPRCCQLEREHQNNEGREIQWESKSAGLAVDRCSSLLPPPSFYHPLTLTHCFAASFQAGPGVPPP